MSPRVTTTFSDGVAEVTLNRPDKLNALDHEMFDAIAAAGESLKGQAGLRAVVLAGAGGNFCAGIDTGLFMQMAGRIEAVRHDMLNPPAGEIANAFQKPVTVWQELPVPVIAALSGVAFGAGAQLALAADFRIAGPDLRLSIMEAKWGLVPDMGITRSLFRLVRADQAKELMMTARILDTDEALQMGLVTRQADAPLDEARAFARQLAERSPEALAGIKRLVDEGWNLPAEASLRLEAEIQAPIIGSPNQIEAVTANLQKRKPRFS